MSREEGFIERVVQNVEQHVQQWREADAARKVEAERHRDALMAEAVERERLLAESIGEEEARGLSSRQAAVEHGAVFVAHSEEGGKALEELASGGSRLSRVIPGRDSGGKAGSGAQGSWLLFERSG